jgi:hypothetical protein
MKNKNVEIINWGLELSDEIDAGNITILTNNSAFMCGCTIDGGCNGFGLTLKIPL